MSGEILQKTDTELHVVSALLEASTSFLKLCYLQVNSTLGLVFFSKTILYSVVC